MSEKLNANYAFYMLAEQANATWGPAATPAYIGGEHIARSEQANADAVKRIAESLQAHLNGCSLSQHPAVLQQRTKAGRKQAKREREIERKQAWEVNPGKATAFHIVEVGEALLNSGVIEVHSGEVFYLSGKTPALKITAPEQLATIAWVHLDRAFLSVEESKLLAAFLWTVDSSPCGTSFVWTQ